ncbi:hypothetical protein CCAX7_006710 [Capsulimonas corticalis]|uniref:DUF4142 domain-containing protein n=1 Tax=Capsulimonas corticalis TaxID=2219043 RepID=A0A402D1E8_9BACT|nr:DUF4142 domain-containing protein [Capsulimonas corticalis]BDI28620.1 hypothetical protein CCAX7_006710 [Capsulimonas corticalis]
MSNIETTHESEEIAQDSPGRRAFLTRMAAAGLGVAAMGLAQKAQAAMAPHQPEADTGHNYLMPSPHATTEKQFRMGVIGPATLSLLTSQIAVDKATDPAAKEFANFELREAIGVTTVLKSLNTPTPPMDAKARATLQKIKTLPAGADFDKTYISAQLANHEFLRDLAETYLANSTGHTSMPEMHGRHLAMLALATFKEHVVHTKNILKTL